MKFETPFRGRRSSSKQIRTGRLNRQLSHEALERRLLLTAVLQNPLWKIDVDDDGHISPIDALHVINRLNLERSLQPPSTYDNDFYNALYLDVSGDQHVSPLDALLVINVLHSAVRGPALDLGLALDSGSSPTDLITNDPRLRGIAMGGASPTASARMRVNHDAVVNLPIAANGQFEIDPRLVGEFNDGPARVAVAVTLANGGTSLRHLHFNYDATAPVMAPPHLLAIDDTGFSNTDNVTRVANPRLQVDAEVGSQLVVRFGDQELAKLVSTGVWETQLGLLVDGLYDVTASATDLAGNVTQTGFPVTINIDTLPPAAVQLDLAITSDTGIPGDSQTGSTRVTLVGKADRHSIVTLAGLGLSVRATNEGTFRVPSVQLAIGSNTFTSQVIDLAGNAGPDSQTTLQRIVENGLTDPVVRWDNAALAAIQLDATTPIVATRNLAMMSLAIFDVVNAVEGAPGILVALKPPVNISPEAAASSAAFEILKYAYPAQESSLAAVLNSALVEVADGPGKAQGISFGQSIAQAIIALRSGDGWNDYEDYSPTESPGKWRETAPVYAPALAPQWKDLKTFVVNNVDAILPSGPPDLISSAYGDAVQEVASLGRDTSSTRTADQTQIARFWADGGGTYTPPGHWNAIAAQVAQSAGNSWGENALLFAKLNAALGDAAIVAWDAKYRFEFWRPITAIREADLDGNAATSLDRNWSPLLVTPAFPEYISGHSTFSGAAAKILTDVFGSSVAFSSDSLGLPGVQRSYTSFDQAAAEAGRSRVYGGIHYDFSNVDGLTTGRAVAQEILDRFAIGQDSTPPQVVFTSPAIGSTTSTNPTIRGEVIDNLSGVKSAQAAIDGGGYTALSLNSEGSFALSTQFALTGSDDGPHVVHFRAIDYEGLISSTTDFAFILDTQAPAIVINGLANGSAISQRTTLEGIADGTGSPLTALSYQIDQGAVVPLSFDPLAGNFDQSLDLSKVLVGTHSLTMVARDAAGLTTTTRIDVHLDVVIPFSILSATPASGAVEVGTTFHPQVFFSRAVRTGSLTSSNFYATDTGGNKLPANIVPAQDGSFAWLYFQSPMPGASMLTLHVLGDSILAESDGQPLDADGDGAVGGTYLSRYTTVSRTPVLGTSLRGRVVDPGDDLKPMTFDDIRSGADGILHTGDDVFLHPLAGVKVFVIGTDGPPAITDAQGNFYFAAVPTGDVKLAVDGRTATNAPAGLYFPEMVMDLKLVAGQANTVMGTMGTSEEQLANRQRFEVYLPRVQSSILHDVSPNSITMIGVDAVSAPQLTVEQRQSLRIEIQPGSLLDQNGNPIAVGQVGISAVPPELVRDMLPPGVLQHTFDITIQAPGIANFSRPAKLTFPNVFHAAPGTKLNFLSFDHTTGRLVIDGTATVSADGLSVVTDPGNGITRPGWHGMTPPGSSGSPACTPEPEALSSEEEAAAGPAASPSLAGEFPMVVGLHDYLFIRNGERGLLRFTNSASPLNPNVNLCGPVNSKANRMQVIIKVPPAGGAFLQGLRTQTINLLPGKNQQIEFGIKPQQTKKATSDSLIGAQFSVEIREISPRGKLVQILQPKELFYLYRYVDASDDNAEDAVLKFNHTINDGSGGNERNRTLQFIGDRTALPTITLDSPTGDFIPKTTTIGLPGQPPGFAFHFDPTHTQDNIEAAFRITTPGPSARLVNGPATLKAMGNGTAPLTIYLNAPAFELALVDLVKDSSPVKIVLEYRADLLLATPSPTTFQLLLPREPDVNVTPELKLGATAVELEQALVQLSSIGPDGVKVTFVTVPFVAPGVSATPMRRDTYVISPQLVFQDRETPEFRVLDAFSRLNKKEVTRLAPQGLLTQNQRNLFRTKADRDAFFKDVLSELDGMFVAVKPAIDFSLLAPPTAKDFGFNILNGTSRSFHDPIAEYPTSAFEPLKAFFASLFTSANSLNGNQVSFTLAQILGDARRDNKKHQGSLYLGTFFGPNVTREGDAGRGLMVSELASVLAHETTHGLGVPHMAKNFAEFFNEIQQVQVQSGVSGFSLEYAGAPTLTLSPNATPQQVEDALLKLPGLIDAAIHVTGPNGGPYTIAFADPSVNRSLLQGVNMPQLKGTGILPTITLTNGSFTKLLRGQVIVGGNQGINDLMTAYSPFYPLTFLPFLSQTLQKLSLGTTWGSSDGVIATSSIAQASLLSHFAVPAPLPGDDDPQESEDYVFDRPGMSVFSDQGAVTDSLDFGTVQLNGTANQSVIKQLKLINFGTESVTVQNVSVTQSVTQFSVASIPPTILLPGESLQIDMSFAPTSSGTAKGVLFIEASSQNFSGRIELTGIGQRVSTPAIRAIFPQNNFEGVSVGETQSLGAINAARGYGELPTVINDGDQPLTITHIRMASGRGQGEYSIDFPTPVTVQPGEEFAFNPLFRPSSPGLRPGLIEILSNDPLIPLTRLPIVGSGLRNGSLDYGNDFLAIEPTFLTNGNTPVLRTRTSSTGAWDLFLPGDTSVHSVTFDPVSGLLANGSVTSSPSGVSTQMNIGVFGASLAADSDGDGLPDDIEFAIGTSLTHIDSDLDGIDDFNEIEQGLNPLDNRSITTGVVAALALQGAATDIALAAKGNDPNQVLAYIATSPFNNPALPTGLSGLSVADVTQFDRPFLLGQIVLPGSGMDVEVDRQEQLAAIATGAEGVHIVDVSNLTDLKLVRTIPVAASHILLFDGLVYASIGNEIRVYDIDTGEQVDKLTVGGTVSALRREGSVLFSSVDSPDRLLAIDLANAGMVILDSFDLPLTSVNLFVADGVAWVKLLRGYVTVDVSMPNSLRLLRYDQVALGAANAFVLNGSGLGILVGGGPLVVVAANDPAASLFTISQVALPGASQAAALSAGLAFVATQDAGLQVVNFLPIDQGSIPPEITVSVNSDNDATRPGLQMSPGSTVFVSAKISEDVQIRHVELLVDGVVVRREVSYPFDLTAKLPSTNQPGAQSVLQVRATDTGGNVRLSDRILIELIPDHQPPTILEIDPSSGSTRSAAFRNISIRFSEAIANATATLPNFELIGPAGPVDPVAIRLRQSGTRLDLRYLPLAGGAYRLLIHAERVTDVVGSALGVGDIVSTFFIDDGSSTPTAEIQAGRLTYTGNLPLTGGQLRAVADFNADGFLDVAAPFGSYGGKSTTLLLGRGDGSFQPAPDSQANDIRNGISAANQVEAADFNNDGKLDLVGAAGLIQVHLGNGDGTFGAKMVALTEQYGTHTTMAVGDFNRDGKMDIVAGGGLNPSNGYYDSSGALGNGIAFATSGGAVVLLGQGDGTFSYSALPGNNSFLSLPNLSLIAADIDNDGNLDLIATDGDGSKLRILRGLGDGTFARSSTTNQPIILSTDLPAGAQLATIADFNGDGRLDAAVTGARQVGMQVQFGRIAAVTAGNSTSILIGLGDGTFESPVVYDTPGAMDVIAADYNGDGRPDLVLTRPADHIPTLSPEHGSIQVLINQGNATFGPAITIEGAVAPLYLASGDFNRDGRRDLIQTIQNQGASVLFGNGAGSFATAKRYSGAPSDDFLHSMDFVRTADMNKDGFKDVILIDSRGLVHVRLGNGDGTFQSVRTSVSGGRAFAVAIGDINGDGILDLVHVRGTSLIVLVGLGDGRFQSPLTIEASTVIGPFSASDVSLADLNGDGILDVTVGFASRALTTLRGNGDGTFQNPVRVALTATSFQLEVGDFDEDGDLDIATLEQVVGSASATSPIRILLGDGNGAFIVQNSSYTAPPVAAHLTIADVDGDGHLDLITAVNWTTLNGSIVTSGTIDVFRGVGDGTFEPPKSYGSYGWSYFEVVASDVNADGHLDLVASTADISGGSHLVGGFSSRGLAVLYNLGDGTFGDPTFYNHGGSSIAGIAADDMNSDGLIDIVTANGNDNTVGILFAKSLTVAQLRASIATENSNDTSIEPLGLDRLPNLIDEAIRRWSEAGISPPELERMRRVNWRVADLGNDLLGQRANTVITLDDDAAGWGWFADATPNDDEEFELLARDVRRAKSNSTAKGRMDLLTVILHELGHLAGLHHESTDDLHSQLMNDSLELDFRKRP